MRLSIRSRLTLWYTAVVVAILLTGGIVGSLAQARLALQGLDDDLTRTMATLVGVMHTEIGEGLSRTLFRRRPETPRAPFDRART